MQRYTLYRRPDYRQAMTMDSISRDLLASQSKAERLFEEVIDGAIIQAGKLESELSAQIHSLAQARFGLRRHWHKRNARSGPNTVLTYHDDVADRRITDDDIVYLDFGPAFDEREADFGRPYVLGADAAKLRLIGDIAAAFQRGKDLYRRTPDLTAGELYDFVASLAAPAGWEFGAPTAGHLIGRFPHESSSKDGRRFSIRHGNNLRLCEPDDNDVARHWILEIHFID
jgi:Xaa-Pro dipeptidase